MAFRTFGNNLCDGDDDDDDDDACAARVVL